MESKYWHVVGTNIAMADGTEPARYITAPLTYLFSKTTLLLPFALHLQF